MYKLLFYVLFSTSLVSGQTLVPDQLVPKAVEGAKLLRSEMRDPDNFKLDRVWIMRSQKHGDAVCYSYYAKNGFGGMDHTGATYTAEKHSDYVISLKEETLKPTRILYSTHCGPRALKNDEMLKDVTDDVKHALESKP